MLKVAAQVFTLAIAVVASGCRSGGRAADRDGRCAHATNFKNEPFPYAYVYPVEEGAPSEDLLRRERDCIRPGASSWDKQLFYCCRESK